MAKHITKSESRKILVMGLFLPSTHALILVECCYFNVVLGQYLGRYEAEALLPSWGNDKRLISHEW